MGEGGRAQPWEEGEPAENTQHGVKTMAVHVPFPMVHGCRLVEGTNLGGYLRNLVLVLKFWESTWAYFFYSPVEKGIKKKSPRDTKNIWDTQRTIVLRLPPK